METKINLKSFFTEHWKYMAVSTACKLDLFDHLQEYKTAKQLATEHSWNENALLLLLNSLHHIGFLDKKEDLFKINDLSELLTEKNPESLKYACMLWSAEHLTAWQNLEFSIKTGKSSFEKLYQKPFFDYLNQYPEKLDTYHKAMYEYARDDYKNLPDIIDFSQYQSIMDVGGGYGALLQGIKTKNPRIECILFDLPQVVQNVTISNIKKIGGSFFEKIPIQADAIVLSRVLHDWNDEKAKLILKNCCEALYSKGVLYVIENCSDKIKIDLSLLSLNMLAICESYERTAQQYVELCESTGFQLDNEMPLNELQTILIFKKI
ncbi:methyltransferase [Thermonema rossianum]|uniref:methyltransferase n=1 Tax=Thermonema rossianum TaxID=55505 RepID=UPI00056E5734|nr:methyltransferase [Thermonema rossianum]